MKIRALRGARALSSSLRFWASSQRILIFIQYKWVWCKATIPLNGETHSPHNTIRASSRYHTVKRKIEENPGRAYWPYAESAEASQS